MIFSVSRTLSVFDKSTFRPFSIYVKLRYHCISLFFIFEKRLIYINFIIVWLKNKNVHLYVCLTSIFERAQSSLLMIGSSSPMPLRYSFLSSVQARNLN